MDLVFGHLYLNGKLFSSIVNSDPDYLRFELTALVDILNRGDAAQGLSKAWSARDHEDKPVAMKQ